MSTPEVKGNFVRAATLAAFLSAGVQPAASENQQTPPPSPSSGHELILEQGMPSQQAWSEQTSFAKATEVAVASQGDAFQSKVAQGKETRIQTIENPIYFTDSLGRQRKWEFDNATFGIPPNDPNTRVGTVYDYINNSNTWSERFQPKTSLYVENFGNVAIGGIVVDVPKKKAYMLTADLRNDGNYDFRVECITDIDNLVDYGGNARILATKNGLPTEGIAADPLSFSRVLGNPDEYLEVVIQGAINPSENGTYRIRLDSQGNFSGPFFKVQQESTPTPTQTPSPTPSPTEAVPTESPTPSPTASETPPPTHTESPTQTSTPTPWARFKAWIPIAYQKLTNASW